MDDCVSFVNVWQKSCKFIHAWELSYLSKTISVLVMFLDHKNTYFPCFCFIAFLDQFVLVHIFLFAVPHIVSCWTGDRVRFNNPKCSLLRRIDRVVCWISLQLSIDINAVVRPSWWSNKLHAKFSHNTGPNFAYFCEVDVQPYNVNNKENACLATLCKSDQNSDHKPKIIDGYKTIYSRQTWNNA